MISCVDKFELNISFFSATYEMMSCLPELNVEQNSWIGLIALVSSYFLGICSKNCPKSLNVEGCGKKKARKLHAARQTILVFHLCISENSIQDRILPNVINLLVKYSIVNVLVALRIQL